MSNWFTRLFSPPSRASGRVEPVEPWPAPPELSHFVKGLIRSMKETPGEWEYRGYVSAASVFIHRATMVSISVRSLPAEKGSPEEHCVSLWGAGDMKTNETEDKVLCEAVYEYLERPRLDAIMARLAANRAPFEILGRAT